MNSHPDRIEEITRSARLDSLDLLAALPPDQRAAVRGRVIDRRSYEQLARELGCSAATVRDRVAVGLRGLRALSGANG